MGTSQADRQKDCGAQIMGLKWTATLKVEFEMLDGRPDSLVLAQMVLAREANLLKHNIEHGRDVAATGVKSKSAKVRILSQGAALPALIRPCACARPSMWQYYTMRQN
jgi:hypothetical protein